MLYLTLVGPKREYPYILRNSVTSTDTKELEHVQQKFVTSVSLLFFFLILGLWLLTGTSLNFNSSIPCTAKDFILVHYLSFLFIHV